MPSALRPLAGILLAGYGLLVVAGVLPHDALLAGAIALLVGAALLVPLALRRNGPTATRPAVPLRAGLVALLGAACAGGVLGYNLLSHSDFSLPEAALLLYGAALLAASANLARRVGPTEVGTLVAWSFPLLAAPLAIFALNALLAGDTPAPAAPVIAATLTQPLALVLQATGEQVRVLGTNVILPTERGTLTLGVGLVCAGLYPMVLFLGVLGLHGWQQQLAPKRFALYLGLGLLGLYAANLLRLVLLAKVGQAWGGAALQEAHANLGWILFVGFMLLFWGVVLRRLEGTVRTA